MELTSEVLNRIDNMDYYQMLQKWRFAPAGDALMQRPSGDYFAEVMKKKREAIDSEEAVRISKEIGWE